MACVDVLRVRDAERRCVPRSGPDVSGLRETSDLAFIGSDMTDRFETYVAGLEAPASDLFDIVPDDGTDLALATRALNAAVSGTVRITTVSGTMATVYIAAGIAFPVRAARVHATGTTATGLVGLA